MRQITFRRIDMRPGEVAVPRSSGCLASQHFDHALHRRSGVGSPKTPSIVAKQAQAKQGLKV